MKETYIKKEVVFQGLDGKEYEYKGTEYKLKRGVRMNTSLYHITLDVIIDGVSHNLESCTNSDLINIKVVGMYLEVIKKRIETYIENGEVKSIEEVLEESINNVFN